MENHSKRSETLPIAGPSVKGNKHAPNKKRSEKSKAGEVGARAVRAVSLPKNLPILLTRLVL
jgi:hypothetical protein